MDHKTVLKSPDEYEVMSDAQFDYQGWRESFLRIILRLASVAGLALAVVAYPTTPPVTRIFFAIIYLILLLATFLPRLNYSIRASVFLLLVFLIGLQALIGWGPWADANIFFAAFVVVAALLFEPNIDFVALGVSVIAITIAGVLNLTGLLQMTDKTLPPLTISTWLTYGLDFSAMSLLIIWPIRLFKREFSRIADQMRKMFNALLSERTQLEERVQIRTQELEKQTIQLRASTLITREISNIQDVQPMLTQVTTFISHQLGYYHVGIFLVDDQFRTAFLQASSSDAGRTLMEHGYQFNLNGNNIIGRVATSRKSAIATDAGSPEFPLNDPDMPRTHSRLAMPLVARGKVIGVLDIHSERSQAFGQADAEIGQLLADQVATSIENIRLKSETQAVISELEILTAQQTHEAWKSYLQSDEKIYQFTPSGVKQVEPSAKNDERTGLNIPLLLRGQEIGSIALQRKDSEQWTETERDLVEKIATQVALALENSRLLEETRRRASQQQTVSEISARLGRSLDVDTLLQTAARELGSLPDVAEVSVYVEPVNQKEIGK